MKKHVAGSNLILFRAFLEPPRPEQNRPRYRRVPAHPLRSSARCSAEPRGCPRGRLHGRIRGCLHGGFRGGLRGGLVSICGLANRKHPIARRAVHVCASARGMDLAKTAFLEAPLCAANGSPRRTKKTRQDLLEKDRRRMSSRRPSHRSRAATQLSHFNVEKCLAVHPSKLRTASCVFFVPKIS